MNEPTCCACSGLAVARVVDGAYRKPICATHRRMYAERGYLIDALPNRPAHPKSCWCNGTGWRLDLGAPCNLPPTPDQPAQGGAK